jgi:4,5-dihydroxyphthalate decarboxylase
VTRTSGATRALKDGSVRPAHFGLRFEEVPVLIQAFRRMVRTVEFDVSEMAFTTYLVAKAHGKPFTALPVFCVRGFHHGALLRSAKADGLVPKDLEGRRAGVNRGYTVTTGVWARGILADEYGVDLGRVTWVLSGDEHVAEYQPPPNVVPAGPGEDVPEMVASGELAAGIGIPADYPGVVPLIPDAAEAGYRALRDRGFYPINHLVVVRDELLAEHPDLAADLFGAYAEAKKRYVAELAAEGEGARDGAGAADRAGDGAGAGVGRGLGGGGDQDPTDRMYSRVMEITGADPLPYGIAPNQAMIDQLIRYAVDQKILAGPVAAEDLFAAGTHGLTA